MRQKARVWVIDSIAESQNITSNPPDIKSDFEERDFRISNRDSLYESLDFKSGRECRRLRREKLRKSKKR